jgi:hypothetical protein
MRPLVRVIHAVYAVYVIYAVLCMLHQQEVRLVWPVGRIVPWGHYMVPSPIRWKPLSR